MAGLEGQTLDRYELEQLTGRGGMADVYRAFDPRFERSVAVKIFKRDDEELLRRFVREARLMASLNNPHLIPVYDTGASQIDGVTYYFIVMPFMEGGSLRARIRRNPLPLPLVCRYLGEIADALDYIHSRGIIHRDIKSSNVLLDEEGNSYVADFGIARQESDETQATSTGSILGTVDYIAPELFESNQRASVSSDLYSLGVLAFEMVTGRLPFTGENQIAVATMHVNKQPPLPRTFVPNLPLPAERVILRGLEKRPELRYQSATDFADAFCNTISSRATGEMPAEPMWDWEQQETQRVGNQDERIVLPPVPPIPPALPAAPTPLSYGNYGNQQNQQAPVTANLYPQGYSAQQDTSGYAPNQVYPSPQQDVSPASRSTRTRTLIVALLALLVLFAVIGPILYITFTHSPLRGTAPTPTAPTATGTTPTPNLTATSQAQANATATQQAKTNATATAQANQANATATAQANATAVAIAHATATAQANASATPGVLQTAIAGKPTYQDALTDPNNSVTQAAQWDQNNNCTFKSDGYHVTASNNVLGSGQFKGCHEAANQYQNMAISVDMDIVSGHSGGLFFRLGIDSNALGAYSGYLFEVDNTGRYKISSSANFSTGSGNKTLQDWTTSSAIKTGSTIKNTLQVIANGSTLNFYINGTFLTSVTDSGYTSGDIGFLATTTNNGANADIVYSNLSVYP